MVTVKFLVQRGTAQTAQSESHAMFSWWHGRVDTKNNIAGCLQWLRVWESFDFESVCLAWCVCLCVTVTVIVSCLTLQVCQSAVGFCSGGNSRSARDALKIFSNSSPACWSNSQWFDEFPNDWVSMTILVLSVCVNKSMGEFNWHGHRHVWMWVWHVQHAVQSVSNVMWMAVHFRSAQGAQWLFGIFLTLPCLGLVSSLVPLLSTRPFDTGMSSSTTQRKKLQSILWEARRGRGLALFFLDVSCRQLSAVSWAYSL